MPKEVLKCDVKPDPRYPVMAHALCYLCIDEANALGLEFTTTNGVSRRLIEKIQRVLGGITQGLLLDRPTELARDRQIRLRITVGSPSGTAYYRWQITTKPSVSFIADLRELIMDKCQTFGELDHFQAAIVLEVLLRSLQSGISYIPDLKRVNDDENPDGDLFDLTINDF